MPEKRHCYHVAAYHILICDLNIYSKKWAVDNWPGACVCVDDDGDEDDAFLDCGGIIYKTTVKKAIEHD